MQGLLGGPSGEWPGFANNLGLATTYEAELWGALKGLKLAKERSFDVVELQLDSTTVVNT